jgi:peptidoglycan/LPS O-acetylase OafA/YrhL
VLASGLVVPQAWTLGVEVSFYIMSPFILSRRYLIFSILIVSIIIRLYLFFIGLGDKDPWTYRFFPAELVFFLMGALANQFLLPTYNEMFLARDLRKYSVIATVFLIIFSMLYSILPIENIYKWCVLFFSFFLFLPLIFDFQNHHTLDKWIGELSYPIYIGHMLVILVIESIFKKLNIVNKYFFSIVCLVFSIIFAIFLYEIIGKRVDKFRKNFRKN